MVGFELDFTLGEAKPACAALLRISWRNGPVHGAYCDQQRRVCKRTFKNFVTNSRAGYKMTAELACFIFFE
jgi:hypothetical protein